MAADPEELPASDGARLDLVPLPRLDLERPEEHQGFFRRLTGRWRHNKSDVERGLEQLSVSTLQTELRTIDQAIANAVQNLAALQEGEQAALERRDKLALDIAWQGREAETARIEELSRRRQQVYAALVDRFVPEVSAWRRRCEAAVARWRAEDQQRVNRMDQLLRELESLMWELSTRHERRAAEQEKLFDEFDTLRKSAGPIPLACPEVDWSVPPVSLKDVATRVESLRQMIHTNAVEAADGVAAH